MEGGEGEGKGGRQVTYVLPSGVHHVPWSCKARRCVGGRLLGGELGTHWKDGMECRAKEDGGGKGWSVGAVLGDEDWVKMSTRNIRGRERGKGYEGAWSAGTKTEGKGWSMGRVAG